MGNLANPVTYARSFWDWEFLNKSFTSGIQVSDIDGIIERRGFFLVLETKQPGVQSSKGQRIMLENLVRTGYFTVVYVWGFPETPEDIEILAPSAWGKQSEIKVTKSPSSAAHLQEVVGHWFRMANARPRTYKFESEIQADREAEEDRQADHAYRYAMTKNAFMVAQAQAKAQAKAQAEGVTTI